MFFKIMMLMKVKVFSQANLEYGQMREMVHSYQHRLAQARLAITIIFVIISITIIATSSYLLPTIFPFYFI